MPLEETEIKYAPRNMFYDENGRHVRTKKEIMDENKQIRPGCRIIPKGSIYEIRFFSERKDLFKEKSFLQEVKIMYTDLINQCLRDEKDKLQVFDKSGPYLPTKKVGKNNPKAKEIQSDNELRKEWNRTVDQVLIAGGSQEDVIDFKKEYVTDKVAESIRINGNQPGIFAAVLQKALNVLKIFLHFLMFRREKEEKKAVEEVAHRKENENLTEKAEGPEGIAVDKTTFFYKNDKGEEHVILSFDQAMETFFDNCKAANKYWEEYKDAADNIFDGTIALSFKV